ncbi:hypothetical protein GCM10023196_037130 [Actinoallomurus vinaceus]|uniref:Uncharacterized protein n=1 Tax=Actinoallomurus vinaceus TaxID=1080074 RepID=A0ABP8U9H3_9ACTN
MENLYALLLDAPTYCGFAELVQRIQRADSPTEASLTDADRDLLLKVLKTGPSLSTEDATAYAQQTPRLIGVTDADGGPLVTTRWGTIRTLAEAETAYVEFMAETMVIRAEWRAKTDVELAEEQRVFAVVARMHDLTAEEVFDRFRKRIWTQYEDARTAVDG